MKCRIIATALVLTSLIFSAPSRAQEDVDLYNLCSQFPLNSRCEGYETPISLADRSGNEGKCALIANQTEQKGRCKVSTTEDELSIYIETGEPLTVLEQELATQTIMIPFSQVVSLDYMEYNQEDQTAGTVGGLLGGLLGAAIGSAFHHSQNLSEIEVGYLTQTTAGQEILTYLTFIVEREAGLALQAQLAASTQPYSETALIEELEARGIPVGNPEHMQQLLTSNNCTDCDLRGASLAGANLQQTNLKGSNLRGVNLEGANLEGANLEGCNLRWANLEGANLQGADLSTKGVMPTNLRHAILRNADLSNAKLDGANLDKADLENANLTGADLTRAVLEDWGGKTFFYTSLREANLRGANFSKADMDRVFLNGADLSGADLSGADLDRAHLEGATLDGANLMDASLNDVELEGVSLCATTMVDGSKSSQGCP